MFPTIGRSAGRQCAAAALLAVVVLASGSLRAHAAELPVLTLPLHDLAGVVDADSAARLDDLSRRLQAATGDVIVVLTVPTYQPGYGDLREYAVKAFENHGKGIGDKERDNGVLIVLAVQDRQLHIEVGYGLEGAITDGFAGETARLYMRPHFQQGRYGEGLLAGATRLAGRIAEERNVDVANLPRVAGQRPGSQEVRFPIWLVIILLIVLYRLYRAGRKSYSGTSSRRGGGVWGGSNWSGWSGGGSFGGGSFGGGFGGFGASGAAAAGVAAAARVGDGGLGLVTWGLGPERRPASAFRSSARVAPFDEAQGALSKAEGR